MGCGTPQELYSSFVTNRFFDFVIAQQMSFGIISDLYGLHWGDEVQNSYDVHPSVLSEGERTKLGNLISKQARIRGFSSIIFYNPSPVLSVPYFKILSHSGLRVFYTTRLGR